MDLNDAQTSSDKKQQVKVYCTYVYACLLSMYTTYVYVKVQKVFRACEVFIISVILLIEILFREHCRR